MEEKDKKFILWFDQVGIQDVTLVGGKNASLGEMYATLVPNGIRVPNGFAVTAHAYKYFIEKAELTPFIEEKLKNLDTGDVKSLQKVGKLIREKIVKAELPDDLKKEIGEAYKNLSMAYGMEEADTAVRSSATAEDLPGASFAGEHETYLNVVGEKNVLQATKEAMASLWNDRAISYRVDKGFNHFDVALSVGVQKMVRSDKGSSGVMFTIDTESGFKDVVEIDASWGLGEMVVQGKVTPDAYLVFKPTLNIGFPAIIKKTIGSKENKMIYSASKESPVKEVEVAEKYRNIFVLNEEEILTLSRWALEIERHYTEKAGKETPMDMEWAKDGITNELFIVQARPETVQSEKKHLTITEYSISTKNDPIVDGIAVGTKIASGKVRVITDVKKLNEFEKGEILVTEITDPDWEPIMKIASAIITEKGGRTSHAAIVSRELGIPAVIGTGNALSKLKTGDMITVDTSSGTTGKVFEGKLEWQEKVHDITTLPETKTKVCMNIGSPESAFMYSFIPNKGVGLAREEFIIASSIRVHPNALLNFDKLDSKLKNKIEKVTLGYEDKVAFYVDKLAEGIGQIGAAFWPNDVVVRFSDFKTNEYATLLGGEDYEPKEENPMLGWRGASRYYDPKFKEAFKLECRAFKKVREQFGLKNIVALIPFCRTPEEGKKVLDIMKEEGVGKGDDGFKVYVMCEIPSNVLRADEFLDIFDGFSIGSNDLAQLTLGLDRDSGIVASISNENDPAVKNLVAMAIQKCRERGKYIGFCGQAPSDYPDFTRFLVQNKIDAISLNPDSVIPMILAIAEEEGKLGN
ncbi:MAG: phosphoenolpyruvate synthase [Candidatus Zambryskibacteria bacterium RIFCSPLOWO2_01_FULL_39_39]|uniref:Phosphoenolpyruvate synthase n=1 Tax=Candidatus Zambryskibacteria bacterium RIFCSPLOWO2_01_FULL_39_39 TaxID=1802758 RepID=A0A1G2TY69_9BACT|nr:MAG: Phosphoenolpyruvate synthase [Parcubacteria group bacterium GW2011_GWA1_38_7]OHA87266.1 MAG: phosphoenolpyruvate synthase [Candidatus Zambryskibacteria bacterium RIFCSPHIGHO2_01_FULL_39_63]OHA95203.1 MAG: phosphoenolpyruvate synthase [Candidatus Zambryskibacteria bacterium RIFCSPHIGHO2_02_FULL_39_19]OHA98735.1 MAG: phosphoenolpyruvate synthase [Candidatus Zambryskibacteria bacterium RIFCSPHIGHO2_12_FULL_39_21]OHB02255.1 MAG: phosphoenolpyruvate synthase [Candidatus Zambryskibacteria bac